MYLKCNVLLLADGRILDYVQVIDATLKMTKF